VGITVPLKHILVIPFSGEEDFVSVLTFQQDFYPKFEESSKTILKLFK